MRRQESLVAPVATAFAAVAMAAIVALAPSLVLANEPVRTSRTLPALPPAAKLPDFRASLDDADEIATLDAIHLALSQVGDGNSYVWHRDHGRLSGVFQPTQSFKDTSGQVCRHLMVMLIAGAAVRKTEGIACRLSNGRWQLDG
jgi:surface antigen